MPGEHKVSEFWAAMENHPQMDGHPLRSRENFRAKCIPVGLRGDDVPITGLGKTWVSKMTQFSWFSLLSIDRSTKDKMMWVYGCVEKLRVKAEGRNTLHSFFKLLAWSLLWLFRDVWPDRDHTGRLQLGFS